MTTGADVGLHSDAPTDSFPRPFRLHRPKGATMALILLLVLTLLAMFWVSRANRTGYLDPAAVDPQGSRAVANLLTKNGVAVSDVRLTSDVVAQAPGATVLVTTPALVSQSMISALIEAGPARIVLLASAQGDAVFDRLAAGVNMAQYASADASSDSILEPGCDYVAAVRAGSVWLPGLRYDARAWAGTASVCYDSPEAASLIVTPARPKRPEVVLLGSADPLTNAALAKEGNASLALSLLGAEPRLVWWRPQLRDPAIAGDPSQTSASELIPAWVYAAGFQLLAACLFLAAWRARRMGPLVIEPLPVVVRSGETQNGRARLLRAGRATGTAAEHLRESAREQLRASLCLPIGYPPSAMVHAAAIATRRPPAQVGELLFGGAPRTEAQLVALHNELTQLVGEVRHS